MTDKRLTLIRQHCDTSDMHLSSENKDLLCKILENPEKYNGFTSSVIKTLREGVDAEGNWEADVFTQYMILIDEKGLGMKVRQKIVTSDTVSTTMIKAGKRLPAAAMWR